MLVFRRNSNLNVTNLGLQLRKEGKPRGKMISSGAKVLGMPALGSSTARSPSLSTGLRH